jgi:hypothetical protein
MSEWQPIITAPKDGDFLLYISNGHISAGRLVNGKFLAADSLGKVSRVGVEATHWMPLPPAPTEKE